MRSLKNPHETNMGGNVRLFLADVSDITIFPYATNAFSDNIKFAAGKGFYEFDCSPQAIDSDVKPDGIFFNHQIKCVVPGLTIERDEILATWQNTPLIILRKDSNGNHYVHGHVNYPLYLTDWKRIEAGPFSSLKSYSIEIQSKPAIPTSAIPYTGLVTIQY